ncbi:MAG TPA: glycosyltransferase family 39 protein [Mucilaginibacter sp.]
MKDTNKTFFLFLLVLALIVNVAGINVNFFTDDPGLYAAISKNLLWKKDFFELFTYNRDWLDKPHFPFWAVLLSFKVFGVSVWAYRLPALLFFFLSLIYTWLFAKKYYGRDIAMIAVLVLATALNIQMSNTDVRAEPYLMALIMGSVYHIASLYRRYSLKHLLLTALLTACAIMTKGIFVIVAVYGAVLGQMIFEKKLREIFRWKWLALAILTILFTFPELYALYTQFDLHPEKTVFERHNVSGIKWFLWDSQFGRFINSGPINRKASGSKFFYLHTLLWAFAPWCLLFYYAVFKNIKNIIKHIALKEYYTLSGGLLLLMLFSLSGFQLPFYTNAVFPLFAIITAPFCIENLPKFGMRFRHVTFLLYAILLIAAVVIIDSLLKPSNYLLVTTIFAVLGFTNFFFKGLTDFHIRIFAVSCLVSLFAGCYLNVVFYNEITPYKGEIAAASYINQKPFDKVDIYSLKFENNNFQFYCKRPVKFLPIGQLGKFHPTKPSVFFASQLSIDYLKQTHVDFKILKSFITYPQENILPAFINKKTRQSVLGHVYLIYR